ncbi:hypothetical protein ACIO6T_12315 [Streptomyces sp. NPDC087532]
MARTSAPALIVSAAVAAKRARNAEAAPAEPVSRHRPHAESRNRT